jgi:VanZ family protein
MRYRGSLAVWVALIAYASLYPFWPLRLPSSDAFAAFFMRPRYTIEFDIFLNVVAYIPLGVLARLHFGARGVRFPLLAAIALGAALSLTMEFAQLFIPNRVASVQDVAANTAGTAIGALLFADPVYSLVTRPLGGLRERVLVAGPWGDAGVVLLALWLIAQLNPALPFFGAGNIASSGLESQDTALLQWAAVGMSVCGFGLFVSAILSADHGSLRTTLVLLSIALWLKFMAASFMLQPHFAEEWLSIGRVLGLGAGIAALVVLRRMPRLARIYLAFVLILAGALFAKIFGAYSAIDELVKLFRWPYGQLAGFATLTRFLHEGWALLAVVYLIALFLHERRERSPGGIIEP